MRKDDKWLLAGLAALLLLLALVMQYGPFSTIRLTPGIDVSRYTGPDMELGLKAKLAASNPASLQSVTINSGTAGSALGLTVPNDITLTVNAGSEPVTVSGSRGSAKAQAFVYGSIVQDTSIVSAERAGCAQKSYPITVVASSSFGITTWHCIYANTADYVYDLPSVSGPTVTANYLIKTGTATDSYASSNPSFTASTPAGNKIIASVTLGPSTSDIKSYFSRYIIYKPTQSSTYSFRDASEYDKYTAAVKAFKDKVSAPGYDFGNLAADGKLLKDKGAQFYSLPVEPSTLPKPAWVNTLSLSSTGGIILSAEPVIGINNLEFIMTPQFLKATGIIPRLTVSSFLGSTGQASIKGQMSASVSVSGQDSSVTGKLSCLDAAVSAQQTKTIARGASGVFTFDVTPSTSGVKACTFTANIGTESVSRTASLNVNSLPCASLANQCPPQIGSSGLSIIYRACEPAPSTSCRVTSTTSCPNGVETTGGALQCKGTLISDKCDGRNPDFLTCDNVKLTETSYAQNRACVKATQACSTGNIVTCPAGVDDSNPTQPACKRALDLCAGVSCPDQINTAKNSIITGRQCAPSTGDCSAGTETACSSDQTPQLSGTAICKNNDPSCTLDCPPVIGTGPACLSAVLPCNVVGIYSGGQCVMDANKQMACEYSTATPCPNGVDTATISCNKGPDNKTETCESIYPPLDCSDHVSLLNRAWIEKQGKCIDDPANGPVCKYDVLEKCKDGVDPHKLACTIQQSFKDKVLAWLKTQGLEPSTAALLAVALIAGSVFIYRIMDANHSRKRR